MRTNETLEVVMANFSVLMLSSCYINLLSNEREEGVGDYCSLEYTRSFGTARINSLELPTR